MKRNLISFFFTFCIIFFFTPVLRVSMKSIELIQEIENEKELEKEAGSEKSELEIQEELNFFLSQTLRAESLSLFIIQSCTAAYYLMSLSPVISDIQTPPPEVK
ncbi:MAG: hypothetical protein K1X92_05300 [Bacteroidia bacterium]|nr:hypothetical protein [Bacteroidia bacterium]